MVEQAEVRLRRVRRVLGRGQAPRAGGCGHPQHGCAESVLGAGSAGHSGVGAFLLHRAGTGSPAAAGISPAGGKAGPGQRGAGEPVSLRRQGGYLRPVAGGGLVLPHGGQRTAGAAILQVRGGDGAVRHGERPGLRREGLVRPREIPLRVRRAVPGGGYALRLRVCGSVQVGAEADRSDESGDFEKRAGGHHAPVLHPLRRGGERGGVRRLDAALCPHQRESGSGFHRAHPGAYAGRRVCGHFAEQGGGDEGDGGQPGRDERRYGRRRHRRYCHCRLAGGRRQAVAQHDRRRV